MKLPSLLPMAAARSSFDLIWDPLRLVGGSEPSSEPKTLSSMILNLPGNFLSLMMLTAICRTSIACVCKSLLFEI